MKVIIFLVLCLTLTAGENHEYAPIKWLSLDSLERGGADLFALTAHDSKGNTKKIFPRHLQKSKVLIITYMANWCPNCNYQAPLLSEIYEKFHSAGLESIVIMEYSALKSARLFVDRHKLTMPIYFGQIQAKDKTRRQLTEHYKIRRIMADERSWGTPFSIIIEKNNFSKIGFIAGEFKLDELELYLTRLLGEKF
ncbi:MAG: redoxin domain-containing protein [Candidatus Neomarinimicrobiota bacterium]